MMFSVKAVSWDTQPRLPYNRNAPRNPNKKPESETDSVSLKTHPQTVSLAVESVQTKSIHVPVTGLLKKSRVSYQVNSDNSYHGYEQWLPSPPKVEKPRSLYNAASLAYIGDCIYEFYARRHFLFPPLSIEEHNDRVTAIVRCEAQDELLQKLLADNYLSEEERDVLRWGKNVGAGKSRSKKRVGAAIYNRASSLETLIGYLYLTNVKRLEDVMLKLGFSTGAPVESVQGENYFSTSCCACSSLSYSYVLNQMLKIENKQTVYYVVPVRKDLLLSWSSLHYKGDMRLFWPACSTRKVKLNLV